MLGVQQDLRVSGRGRERTSWHPLASLPEPMTGLVCAVPVTTT
jgi:hypothetical protein